MKNRMDTTSPGHTPTTGGPIQGALERKLSYHLPLTFSEKDALRWRERRERT